MAEDSAPRNMRTLIEMFETGTNNAEEEDVEEIVNATLTAYNIAMGMKNQQNILIVNDLI